MTSENKQRRGLTVLYTGPRGGLWELTIEGFEGNLQIRQQLQDSDYEAEWKSAYLDSLYDEQIRQPNEAKHHRYNLNNEALNKYVYSDSYGLAQHVRNFNDGIRRPLSGTSPAFELQLESQDLIVELLQLANDTQRERISLFYLFGYSYTEIAEIQDVSPTAVRNSINRGLEAIRKNFRSPVQNNDSSCLKGKKEELRFSYQKVGSA